VEPNTAQTPPAGAPTTEAPKTEAAPSKPTPPSPASKKAGIHILLLIGCIAFAFLAGIGFEKFQILSLLKKVPLPKVIIVMPTPTTAPTQAASPSATTAPTAVPTAIQTATSSATLYSCPATGYVDCMPILDEAKQKACAPEAMTWYKANCPDFKGAAL
jgi:septal ring-binding cell division protein DamX